MASQGEDSIEDDSKVLVWATVAFSTRRHECVLMAFGEEWIFSHCQAS